MSKTDARQSFNGSISPITRALLGKGATVLFYQGSQLSQAFGTGTHGQIQVLGGDTEADMQMAAPHSGRITKRRAKVNVNTANGAFTLKFRKNAVDTGTNIVVGAGVTGTFESEEKLEFAKGDLINWRMEVAGTAGAVDYVIDCEVEYDND